MSELAYNTLNRARFAGLDFDTHLDDLLARLQVQYASDFNDFAVASLGIMLLDLTAYGLDTLSFYIDRRASDVYLQTARTRGAVSRLARQLGYKMGGAVASSVDLEVAVPTIYAFDVPIPEKFQFEGPNGLIFEVAQEVVFTPSEQGIGNSKFVPAYEGETIQETFTADDTPDQVFELRRLPDDKYVVQGSAVCTVDGAEWDEVDLLEYGATNQFEIGYNDEPPTLRFGDSISGNIPSAGASIVLTYAASRGKSGRVARNTITDVVSPLVVAFNEIPITVNNPEGASGGDDRETLASAKAFAPKVWKSRQVAVVGEDYEALAGSFASPLYGRVAVAKALSSRSAESDLTVQNYLSDIQDAVTTLNTALESTVTTLNGALTTLDEASDSITTELSAVTIQQSTIASEITTALGNMRAVKDSAGEIEVDSNDIQDLVTSGKSAVDSSSASSGEKITIKEWFDLINSEATGITAAAASSTAAANLAISALNSISDQNDDLLSSISTLTTQNGIIIAQSSILASEVSNIDVENDALGDAVDASESGINVHMDRILAADCKANLVTVPILVRDSGGFYTAPSSGLVNALQTRLNACKEVTQTVAVTSGERFLIEAVIRARVGVKDGYSEAVVKTAVETVIEGVLRGRAFSVSLYESDLDDVILEVDGVGFVNARIEGHLDSDGSTLTSRLDSDGNLIIRDSEIITRGSITITTESYAT